MHFFSPKRNQSPDYDISLNVTKLCFGSLQKQLFHILKLSFEPSIFPEELKSARVTPIFKSSDEQSLADFPQNRCSLKFSHIHRKRPIFEYTF